jgi:hypothetical protein
MRLLLSNNKQVENSVNKDGMETCLTRGEATPADTHQCDFEVLDVIGDWEPPKEVAFLVETCISLPSSIRI